MSTIELPPAAPAQLLIVEDEPQLAALLADDLRDAGYAPHIVVDSREVADWVRARQPDLVLLDVMLPGEDGMSVCRTIRGFSDVPIVMSPPVDLCQVALRHGRINPLRTTGATS